MSTQSKRGQSSPGRRDGRRRIAYSVGRLDRLLRRQIGATAGRFGLTAAQYTALSVLRATKGLSNAELAQRAFVTPQAMNEIIQVLESREIVFRRPDPSHGRIVQLGLTAAGRALLSKCDAAVRRIESEMLSELSDSQSDQLQRSLRSCIRSLEAQSRTEVSIPAHGPRQQV
jgi:DNA-binding MarR family transcriptional regulator